MISREQLTTPQLIIWPELTILHILHQSAQAAVSTLESTYPDVWTKLSVPEPRDIEPSSLEYIAACIIHDVQSLATLVESYFEIARRELDDMAGLRHG